MQTNIEKNLNYLSQSSENVKNLETEKMKKNLNYKFAMTRLRLWYHMGPNVFLQCTHVLGMLGGVTRISLVHWYHHW